VAQVVEAQTDAGLPGDDLDRLVVRTADLRDGLAILVGPPSLDVAVDLRDLPEQTRSLHQVCVAMKLFRTWLACRPNGRRLTPGRGSRLVLRSVLGARWGHTSSRTRPETTTTARRSTASSAP